MFLELTTVLLLDTDGHLRSSLLPVSGKYKVKLTIVDQIGSYETLKGILDGNNISVLLIDESFFDQFSSLGTIKLQQDFPHIEIMLFGEKIKIESGDTFRYFMKPINPEVVMKNVILAAKKNQISQRRRRALQIFQETSLRILESKTEDEALKGIVNVASQIMDDTNRKGHFSHLAILTDDDYLVFYPQHHRDDVFGLLQAAIRERKRDSNSKEDYPAIRLEKENGARIGIVGLAVQERSTQRIDDVTKIPDYIILHESVCSQIAVPIIYGDNKIYGVINIEYPENNAFDENDQAALEALTSLIAIAITQMRLVEKEKKQSAALKTLANMGRWVGEAARLDRDEIFRQAVTHAEDLMGVKDEGYLGHLFLKEGRKLRFSPVHHKSSVVQKITQSLRGAVIDLDAPPVFGGKVRKGIVGRAVETGSIQRVGNVRENPDYIPFSDDVNSQLAVPIKYDNQIIGAINIEHPKVNAFDADDEENLNTLALYISIALKNGDLYAQIRRRAEQYEAVYRAGQIIFQHRELNLVVDELAQQVLNIVGNGVGGEELFSHVSLVEDDVFLRIKSINPKILGVLYESQVNLGGNGINLKEGKQGVSGRALRSRTAINASNIRDFAEDFIQIVPGVKSQLSVPMINGSKSIGVITLESQVENRFSQEDVEKIKLIAQIGAIAIENTRRIVSEKEETVKARRLRYRVVVLFSLVFLAVTFPWVLKRFIPDDQFVSNYLQQIQLVANALIAIGSLITVLPPILSPRKKMQTDEK